MARTSKAGAQDPAKADAEEGAESGASEDSLEAAESNEAPESQSEESAAPPESAAAPEPPAPRPTLIAMLEVRSKQALATGDYRVHAALDQLVGAAHHLKSKASHALETLTGEDAELARQLYRAL